jgi:hypothetical protein
MIFVTVIEPRNREVYVNGVYDDPLGPTPALITLNAGSHIFETLTTSATGSRLVDFAGAVDNVPDLGSVTIDLSPVVPPVPRASAPRRRAPQPPSLPRQGPGPHFIIRDDGRIDFAPVDALDQQGNNLGLLKALHPNLRELARNSVEALDKDNRPHAALLERGYSYLELIDQELEDVSFDRLYVAGVRFRNALDAANEKIAEGELPPFDERTGEVLESLLNLHGPFVLGTAVGLELVSAEARYQRNPVEERELRRASQEFARELLGRPEIISPEAAKFILGTTEEIGVGKNPERSTIVATATVTNVVIVSIAAATISALAVVGGIVAGPAGLVGGAVFSLLGFEALKKSKSFLAIVGMLTNRIDRISDSDFEREIVNLKRRLEPHGTFVQAMEPTLKKLGNAKTLQVADQFSSMVANA